MTELAEQDWFFTFAANHRAYAINDSSIHESFGDIEADVCQGFRLGNRYVVIHGEAGTARSKMDRIFGAVWSTQYPSREAAGVEEYGLTELVIA